MHLLFSRFKATLLALTLAALVMADAGAPAYLAPAPFAVMLAYRRAATLLVLAFFSVVVADAASAYFARASHAVMLAYRRAATLLALAVICAQNASLF